MNSRSSQSCRPCVRRTLAIAALGLLGAAASAQLDYSVSSVTSCDPRGLAYTPSLRDAQYFLRADINVTGTSPSAVTVRFQIADRTVEVTSTTPSGGKAVAFAGVPCPLDGSIPWTVTLDPYGKTTDSNLSNNVASGTLTPTPPTSAIDYWGTNRLSASQTLNVHWTGAGTVDRLLLWFGQPYTDTFQKLRSSTGPTGSTLVNLNPFGYPIYRTEFLNLSSNTGATIGQGMIVDSANVQVNATILGADPWTALADLPASVQPFLSAERTVQSTNATIANFVTANLPANYKSVEGPYAAARQLFQAVVKALAYNTNGPGDALAALTANQGDDSGFARLYVAALRNAGIPARLVAGWEEGAIAGQSRWRSWVELYLAPSGWIVADPGECDRISPNGDYAYEFGNIPDLNTRVAVSYGDTFNGDSLTCDFMQGGFGWFWGTATGPVMTSNCSIGDASASLTRGFVDQSASGSIAFWRLNTAGAVTSWKEIGSPGGNAVACGMGDFNNDGQSDLMGQYPDGTIAIWSMVGDQVTSWSALGFPGANVAVRGVGDFDNDGHPDFLGQNTVSGDIAIWSLNGSHVIAWHDVGATPARVVGVGDFDGDGNLDFLGQFTDGTLGIWFMKNYRVVGWQPLGSPGSVTAVGVADIDNDGHADILGIDPSTHRLAVWFTNGKHVIGFENIGDLSSGIQVRCAATLTR